MEFFYVLLGIVVLFFVVLIVKQFVGKKLGEKVCAICIASTLTWVFLLVLHYLGKFDDVWVIALLMGATVLGIFYTWERNVKEKVLVFRLPMLLSLFFVGYNLLSGFDFRSLVLLIVLWVVFGVVYLYGSDGKVGSLVRKLVECCKKW